MWIRSLKIQSMPTPTICEENTTSHQLKNGRKTIYLRHQRFLHDNHPCQRLKKAFNGH